MEDEGLPEWFHGPLTREEAEKRLAAHGQAGSYLVRSSHSQSGFVLSMLLRDLRPTHYQIKQLAGHQGRQYLTFDMENTRGPMFQSLSGILNYIIHTPSILQNPLTSWVPCPEEPDYLEPTQLCNRADGPQRSSFNVSSSLAGVLSDVLALKGVDLSKDQSPFEMALNQPAFLENAPKLTVRRRGSDRSPGQDTATGRDTLLQEGQQLELVSTERGPDGQQFLICMTDTGAKLRFPAESTLTVLHSALTPTSSLKKRPEAVMTSLANLERPPLPRTAVPGTCRRPSLMELYESSGGMKLQHRLDQRSKDQVFYRDVIKQGWLSKLPPTGNAMQSWKRRWFRLVVTLSASSSMAPVNLEYCEKPTSSKPKGVINLSSVLSMSRADSSDVRWKRFAEVPWDTLFKLVTPNRTYPLRADSMQDVTQWLATLNEVMGFTEDGLRLAESWDSPPIEGPDPVKRQFLALLLNQAFDNHDVLIQVGAAGVELRCPQTKSVLEAFSFDHIKCYGFIKQIFWLELGEGLSFGEGLLCFSSQHTQTLYESISHNSLLASDKVFTRRFSRKQFMSWSSIEETTLPSLSELVIPNDSSERPKTETTIVFGQALAPAELTIVGVAVATSNHVPTDSREVTLREGDGYPVCRTRAFLSEGYWVVETRDGFRLMPEERSQVHDHNFSSLQEMDDFPSGSMDSLLQGVDTRIFDDVESPALAAAADGNGYVNRDVAGQHGEKYVNAHVKGKHGHDNDSDNDYEEAIEPGCIKRQFSTRI